MEVLNNGRVVSVDASPPLLPDDQMNPPGEMKVQTPVVSIFASGWLGLASMGLLIFFAIQAAGVWAIWQLAVAQKEANSHSSLALDIVRQQARDWQSALSQVSIEHRDLVEVLKALPRKQDR